MKIKKSYHVPNLFINNKSEAGYTPQFKHIYTILTNEKAKKCNLQSITSYFETALINSQIVLSLYFF